MTLQQDVDILNLEIQNREPFLTVAGTGFDGDPNLGPSVLNNAPPGSWYQRGNLAFYRKRSSGASSWVVTDHPQLNTFDALTFPVDYNDGTAIDPPVGLLFQTQAEIDDFLTTNGVTNFKHLKAAFDSIPPFYNFDVIFSCAGSIHRPTGVTAEDISWDLTGKVSLNNARIFIDGPVPSTWPAISGLSALSVTGTTAGPLPSITVSGTPFAGLDLRGRYLVTAEGQVLICYENDDSTLGVLTDPSPAPTAVTVCDFVGAYFRNSLTDLAGSALNNITMRMGDFVQLRRVTGDAWGAASNATVFDFRGQYDTAAPCENILMNMAAYFEVLAVTSPNVQFGIQTRPNEPGGSLNINGMVYRPPPLANDNNNFIATFTGDNGVSATFGAGPGWYLAGSRLGLTIRGGGVGSFNNVFDELGQAAVSGSGNGLIQVREAGNLRVFNFGGKDHEYRGFRVLNPADVGAIVFKDGATIDNGTPSVIMSDMTMPCVRIEDASVERQGFIDGGGNTDVGVEIIGPGARVVLDADVDVTGTNGDVRLPDGTILTYAQLEAETIVFLDTLTTISKLT